MYLDYKVPVISILVVMNVMIREDGENQEKFLKTCYKLSNGREKG
jgi:hypothetical protein